MFLDDKLGFNELKVIVIAIVPFTNTLPVGVSIFSFPVRFII